MVERLTPTQRALYIEEIRDKYDAYQANRRKVQNRIRREIEAQIAAAEGDLLVGLSKTLHEYHRKGVTKADLRTATRKYGNQRAFLEIWEAYTPEDDFSLAPGRSTSKPYRREGENWFLVESPLGTLSEAMEFERLGDSAVPLDGKFLMEHFGGFGAASEWILDALERGGDKKVFLA